MHRLLLFLSTLFLFYSCMSDREIIEVESPVDNPDYELIHYWNFNNASSLETPIYTKGGASFRYSGAYFDDVNPGSEINARNNDAEGTALRLRNPSGEFILSLPTSGHKDVILSYAATRTGSGSQTQSISYTTDGQNYTTTGLGQTDFTIFEDTYVLIQINFSAIDAVDENSDFKVKITFDEASSLIENGNNRIDNITLDGIPTGQTVDPDPIDPDPTDPVDPDPTDPIDTELNVIHYWNFNALASGNNPEIIADSGNGQIEYLGNYYDRVSPGSDVNARNEDEAGYALRLRNASGNFILTVPTTGNRDIVLKYAATRTGSGSQTQSIWYSVDGINYTQANLSVSELVINEDDIHYTFYEIDFSNISGAQNNANFKIKITFDAASGTISNGNNRIDNMTIEGKSL